MAQSTARTDDLSPSQKARLERLREPGGVVPLSIRLATQIEEACDELQRIALLEITVQDELDMAWLVLCDRGWPRDMSPAALDMTVPAAWQAEWAEYVALPPQVTTPIDRQRLQWIEDRLRRCEAPLGPLLPAGLLTLVHPLDATGRATLAYVLQALTAWCNAHAVVETLRGRKEEVLERFVVFRHTARTFGVRAPLAALDLVAWRKTASAIRAMPA